MPGSVTVVQRTQSNNARVAGQDFIESQQDIQVAGTSSARIAGNHYIENLNVQKASELLSLLSADELDALSIANERFFKLRFRFAISLENRPRLLDLMHRGQLLEEEVQLLHRTGNLRCDEKGVLLTPCRFVAWWAWTQIVIFLAAFVVLFAQLSLKGAPSVNLWIAQIVVSVMMLGFAKLFHYTYVKPVNIALRAIKRLRTNAQ